MTWLDRIILFIAPVLALQREEARRRLELKHGRKAKPVDGAGWRPSARAPKKRFLALSRRSQP